LIPYGRQEVTQEDIDSVVNVLQSDFLTQGPAVPKFENGVSNYCRVKHGVATNSATSALHIACLALGLGAGDILWTSPITFVASANCGLYCGAKVSFVDIDLKTFNMCPIALEKKLKVAEASGELPKIVIPVHMCGQSCDMEAIHKLSTQYGFAIIEDASHAIGGKYKNEPVGNCAFSDITVFSFHPVKIMTTGEGGMAMTNSVELSDTMKLLRSHGITRNASKMIGDSDGGWYYQQVALGFNYRMTDIQAALGVSQLERVDANVQLRHELAKKYDDAFVDTNITPQQQELDSYSSYHLYCIQLEDVSTPEAHSCTYTSMRDAGIGVNVHYIPVHTQPVYKTLGFKKGDYPAAEKYYHHALTLPLFPSLSADDQELVISTLSKAWYNLT
jgi:UDP-4-amino-4,6-dideoxy-N-acetyl-beta-L-altrosamine transaminase